MIENGDFLSVLRNEYHSTHFFFSKNHMSASLRLCVCTLEIKMCEMVMGQIASFFLVKKRNGVP